MTTMKGSVLRSAPLALLRGVLFAAVLSAALILLFALFVLLFDLGVGIVTSVNQVIKVLSILFGTLVAAKGNTLRGYAAGLAVAGPTWLWGSRSTAPFPGSCSPLRPWPGTSGSALRRGFCPACWPEACGNRRPYEEFTRNPARLACNGGGIHV